METIKNLILDNKITFSWYPFVSYKGGNSYENLCVGWMGLGVSNKDIIERKEKYKIMFEKGIPVRTKIPKTLKIILGIPGNIYRDENALF